ncbi:MAG: outer membrane beta-barrel protein [Limisphaerales bacterium]
MKQHHWTLALASVGLVSLGSLTHAEEQAMSQVLTSVSSTTLSGYVSAGAGWKLGGTGETGMNMPGRFNDDIDKMQGFNLNVAAISVGKALSDEDLWAAGYQVDLLFGPDAVAYNPVLGGANAEVAIKQAYVNLLVPVGNGLDVKVGVQNTIIGYEGFDVYANPNFGISYGWQIEPTQQTGVTGSYQITEAISFTGGVANTHIAGVNTRGPNDKGYLAFLGALSVTAPDSWGALSGSSFTVGAVGGDLAGNGGPATYANNFYAGFNLLTGLEGFSVGGAFDYQDTASESYVWALAGYASFAATEKITLNARLDYTRGSDGIWSSGGLNTGGLTVNDKADELFAVTGTLDYQLWANVLTRLELRWDTALDDSRPFGREDDNAITLMANMVYMF